LADVVIALAVECLELAFICQCALQT
jgi:hypothetical protein